MDSSETLLFQYLRNWWSYETVVCYIMQVIFGTRICGLVRNFRYTILYMPTGHRRHVRSTLLSATVKKSPNLNNNATDKHVFWRKYANKFTDERGIANLSPQSVTNCRLFLLSHHIMSVIQTFSMSAFLTVKSQVCRVSNETTIRLN